MSQTPLRLSCRRAFHAGQCSVLAVLAAMATATGTKLATAGDLAELRIASRQAAPVEPSVTATTSEGLVADEESIAFSADALSYDTDTGIVRAVGNVELRRDGYQLQTQEIIYNETTGQVIARGGVRIIDPDGNILTATEAELDDSLRRGVIENVRLVLDDGSRVAAQRAASVDDDGRTRLDRAVYSPCFIEEADDDSTGEEKPPVWQIKAVRVIHDRGAKRLYYKDAYLEVLGLPILWLPYLSHPDPSVDRASGFLPVEVRLREELGLVLEAPYHIVFSDSRDLTLTPILTTRDGPVLAADYRQHVGDGIFNLGGSITYTNKRDDLGVNTGREEFRGHVDSNGRFLHSSAWRSTYHVRWASDDTYLRRYNFSNDDTLTSSWLTEGFFGRSYFGAEALAFQGLRIEDVAGLTGYALPLIDAEYVSDPGFLGGTARINANALALTRTDGLDTRRATIAASWEAPFLLKNGMILETGGSLRLDAYNVEDALRPDNPRFGGESGSRARFIPEAHATLRWPLAKSTGATSQVLEPIVQVVTSSNNGEARLLPNEDSRTFELNDLNLFDVNRTPGFDLWEGGTRLTYGFEYSLQSGPWDVTTLVGQSFRLDRAPDFALSQTGLNSRVSDLISRVNIGFRQWLDLSWKAQFDKDNLAIRRNEAEVDIDTDRLRLNVGYIKLNRGLTVFGREDREEIRLAGRLKIDKQWSLEGDWIENLGSGPLDTVEYGFGLIYGNECLELGLLVRERFTRDRDVEPGTQIQFRIKLRNLG